MDAELTQTLITGGVAIITAIIGYALVRIEHYIKAKTGLQVDAYHREALHSALATGAKLAVSGITRGGVSPYDEDALRADLRNTVRDYVRRSVPDALSHFSPPEDVLNDLAKVAIERAKADATSAVLGGIRP